MNLFNLAVNLTAPQLKKYEYTLSTGQELCFFAKNIAEADEMFKRHMVDICDHPEFKNGICVDCDYDCEHQEIEDNTCLYCGEDIEPNDPRSEPEYWEDR